MCKGMRAKSKYKLIDKKQRAAIRVLVGAGLLKFGQPKVHGNHAEAVLTVRLCFDEDNKTFLNYIDSEDTLSASAKMSKAESDFFISSINEDLVGPEVVYDER
jgi:hypothetical protein